MNTKEQVRYNAGYRELVIEGEGSEAGKVYEVKMMGALTCYSTMMKIVGLVGPTFASMFDNEGVDSFEESTTLTEGVILLLNQLEKTDDEALLKTILNKPTVNGKEIDLDEDLRGEFDEFIELVVFALMENFKKPFTKWLKAKGLTLPTLGQKAAEMKGTMSSKSESE